ncbi:MAG: hypothetical protein MUC57_16520 [Desulfobacterales bacterium]|nr:hypothetical protein [Desulfobacterales bacterium]
MDRAFRAGGDAVGAATRITNIPGYLPIFQDRNLTEIAGRNGRALLGDRGALEAGFMGGSFDVGDLSHLIPVVHPFATGTKGHLHTAEFCVTDYEAAVVLPAKLMAMCVIDLLAQGGREARRVKCEFQPRLAKQQYLELMQRLSHTFPRSPTSAPFR